MKDPTALAEARAQRQAEHDRRARGFFGVQRKKGRPLFKRRRPTPRDLTRDAREAVFVAARRPPHVAEELKAKAKAKREARRWRNLHLASQGGFRQDPLEAQQELVHWWQRSTGQAS